MERCSFTTQSFGDSYIIGAEAGEEDALIKVNENFSQNLEIKYSNKDDVLGEVEAFYHYPAGWFYTTTDNETMAIFGQ